MAFKPIEILINAKDNASSVFSGLQGKVAAVGAAIATYFGINAFTGIVRGAADLQQGMSRVQAATGATAAEMQALRKAAEDAGANTKFTSTEAAGALENLAKAGLTAGQAIEALPAVLQLAQAGDIELAAASEMVTKAVMGMGLAFSDAGRVADVLALGANATNTSVTGLAQALSYAAPVAQSLGLSLESTVAIIGKFADAGIDASRAGTALNSILSQFSNPASKFREELSAAGITTSNFESALHQLAAAGPAGSKAITAVGQEAGPALRALLNQGMGALDDLTAKLNSAQGSAAATAATMQNNLNGALNGLSSAWDTVKNALGTPVLPVLQQGVEQLAGAFRAAVADGTVGKFGEAIATAFQAGIKWVREFLGTVDFAAVLARMQEFANGANETFTKIGEYATNAGNTVQLAYGVMSGGANAVMTAIYGIAASYAEAAIRIVDFAARASDALAKISIGEAKTELLKQAEDMRGVLGGLAAVRDSFIQKTMESLDATAKSAQTARDGWAGLAGATDSAAAASDGWRQAVAAANDELAKGAEAAAQAGVAYQKKINAEHLASQAAGEHRAAIAKLRTEYDALVAAGSLTEAVQKLEEINTKLRETPAAASDAKEKLEAAFKNLGLTASADLEDAATRTSAAWDTLVSQGVRSTSVLRDAFSAYANAAMAAAERQGDAAVAATQRMLATKAAAAGLSLEADRGGQIIVKSMRDAEDATHRVGRAASGSAGGFREMGQAAEAAQKKLKELYDRNRLGTFEESSDAIEKARQNKSGNAAILQTDINQQIKDRYGEEFIGNDKAEAAFQRRLELNNYRKNYGNVMRSQQSLNEERNIAAELDRLEREIEAERQANARGGASSPGTRAPAAAPTPAERTTRSSGGSSGVSSGATTVVNLSFNGAPVGSVNTDAAGRASLESFIRALSDDKGRSW